MEIGKAVRYSIKSLQQKIKKLLDAKMRVPYITGFMPNGRKHYHFISILWKLI